MKGVWEVKGRRSGDAEFLGGRGGLRVAGRETRRSLLFLRFALLGLVGGNYGFLMVEFFDGGDLVVETHNRVPHWFVAGACYFVTYRLGDSLPVDVLRSWKLERREWVLANPEPWSEAVEMEYHRRFSARMDEWMDAGYGRCLMRDGRFAEAKMEVLRFFDGERYDLHSAVVMPNHVHVLLSLRGGVLLEDVVRSWKSFSGRKFGELLGEGGGVWMRSYFDRLIRDAGHFESCRGYIRRNPVKAGLREGEFLVYEGEVDVGEVP